MSSNLEDELLKLTKAKAYTDMEIRTIRSQIDKLGASRESLVTDDMEHTLLELTSSLKDLCAFQESLTRLYLQFSAIEDTRSQ